MKSLRDSIEGGCPVCGRDGVGTLDHYLPKANYGEYSFFSLNLVPACDRCNNARNNLVQGELQGERPLHPYFDAFAERRIMTIKPEPDWRAPRLTPMPFDVVGDELLVVRWHIENVVRPAGIDKYLTHLWGSLIADPHPVLGKVATKVAVTEELNRQVKINTGIGKSPNAWRSCFYYGLMTDDGALDHLVQSYCRKTISMRFLKLQKALQPRCGPYPVWMVDGTDLIQRAFGFGKDTKPCWQSMHWLPKQTEGSSAALSVYWLAHFGRSATHLRKTPRLSGR